MLFHFVSKPKKPVISKTMTTHVTNNLNSRNNEYDLLIVDDDSEVRELLTEYFSLKGYKVLSASHGIEYKDVYSKNIVRLVIMDIEMPGQNGIELLKWTKQNDNSPPVLMLSARDQLQDKISGLELGAEDYIVKPFEPRELLARVKVILRREKGDTAEEVYFSGFTFNLTDRILTYEKQVIKLTTGEEELLAIFCTNPNKILSREFITKKIKGYEHLPFDRTIDIRITRLRKKLELNPSSSNILKTVRSKGYQLITANK